MQKTERRFLSGLELRVKRAGQPLGVVGYAAVFDSLSEDLGGFREKIQKGTFAHAIADRADVACLFNHDPNMILGRTTAGTLRLTEDDIGLQFDCDLPDTQIGRDTYTSIKRGDIQKCSFGFCCVADQWSADNLIRTLTDVDLYDVSPVTYPAYHATSLDARSLLWPSGEPEEVRRALKGPTKGVSYFFLGKPKPAPPFRPFNAKLETERARARVRLAELQCKE